MRGESSANTHWFVSDLYQLIMNKDCMWLCINPEKIQIWDKDPVMEYTSTRRSVTWLIESGAQLWSKTPFDAEFAQGCINHRD